MVENLLEPVPGTAGDALLCPQAADASLLTPQTADASLLDPTAADTSLSAACKGPLAADASLLNPQTAETSLMDPTAADTSLCQPAPADQPLKLVVIIGRFTVTRVLDDSLLTQEDPLMLSLPSSSDSSLDMPDSKPKLFPLFSKKKPTQTPAISRGSKTSFRKRSATAKKSRTPMPDEKQACIKAYLSDLVDGPMRGPAHAASRL